MTVFMEKPESSPALLKISAALGEYVNYYDLAPDRDIVVHCFDTSVPNWEALPAAWHRPLNGDIVINFGKVLRSTLKRNEIFDNYIYREYKVILNICLDGGDMTKYQQGLLVGLLADVAVKLRASTPKTSRKIKYDTYLSRGRFNPAQVIRTHHALAGGLTLGSSARKQLVESIVTTTRAVLVHESGHAVFSQHITGKWYAELTPYRKNILSTFEELRSERQQLQRIGTGAAVLRFAADVVVDPAQVVQDILAERDATGDIHVPNLALNSTLCLGRVLYNVYLTREVTKLAGLVEDIVGIERYRKMNMIWERYSSIRESDPETMVQCVNEWAELFPSDEGNEGMKSSVVKIIIAAPPSDDKGDGDESGENSGDGPDSDGADGDPSDSSSKADKKPGEGKSGEGHSDAEVLELPGLADDFAEAVEEAAEAVAEFPSDNNHVFSPKDCKPSRVSYDIAVGETQRNKHMMYSMPVTSSDRQLAKKLGQELQNLNISNRGKFVVASAIPPGRLHSRGMMQQAADRSAGRLSVAQPWKRTVRKVDLNPPITVGILTDVSGSQSWATQFSSRAAWIIARAASEVNGKVAAATFGEEVLITLRPGERPETRVEVQANGMTEMFDHAMGAIDTLLNLLNGSGTRILFVATDGEMVENQGTEMRKTAAWVTRLTKAGVVVVWITPDPHDTTYGLPNTPKHAVCVPVNKHRVGRDPKEAIDQIIGVLKKEMTLRNRRAR